MAILKGWKLDLKQKYRLPLMFTKIMFKSCETEEVKELRRDYENLS